MCAKREYVLGSIVLTTTLQGDSCILGKVVAYNPGPTYELVSSDGKHFTWSAELCTFANYADEVTYWRDRCAVLEAQLEALEGR